MGVKHVRATGGKTGRHHRGHQQANVNARETDIPSNGHKLAGMPFSPILSATSRNFIVLPLDMPCPLYLGQAPASSYFYLFDWD